MRRETGTAARSEGSRQDGSSTRKQDGGSRGEQGKPFAGRWQGCTAVCIASGPSLTLDDCRRVATWRAQYPCAQNRRVIAVNSSHQRQPGADVVFAMDRAWWHEYGGGIAPGPELWTTSREAARVYRLNFIRGEAGGGISTSPNTIRLGGNSGFQALGLALHFGAARIVLLGYDLALTGGRSHWHGNHPRLGNPQRSRMGEWCARFAQLAAHARVPILNATRETALTCFPRMSLDAALAD